MNKKKNKRVGHVRSILSFPSQHSIAIESVFVLFRLNRSALFQFDVRLKWNLRLSLGHQIMRTFRKIVFRKLGNHIKHAYAQAQAQTQTQCTKNLKKKISIRNPMNPRMQKDLDAIPCQIALDML